MSDQTLGAVSVVFKFLSLDVTRLHGQRRVETFESLDAGHLIGARYMGARRGERRGGFIYLTHGADLRGQFDGVVGGWGEPIPLEMGLQDAQLLKNVPPCEEKSASRCHV